ncbi:MAG: beta-xylosidase-like protein [Pseudomonas sp.]|jgi:hypothetical protein|uniref:cellulase family glycosylhydrolase n=1 Tax=Pseudomonas sp. TaxID=306 RepID=UPI002602453D|nr:cellulase family glycosylhydrolase [Pseudomonas sp.]MDB6050297.1 beta-xylosidase-like protein [Pseudomonas sp.]
MFNSNWTPSRQPILVLLMGMLFSFSAAADEPFIIGVGTHLLNKSSSLTNLMKLVADAGITSVRDDAYWSTAEPRRGQLHIDSAWTRYLNEATAHRLSPLMILGYGNPFYDDNAKPRTAQIRSAFANYTKFVSHRLGDSVGFYEIWNEWDAESPGDAAMSNDYSALVTETAQQIRSENKHVKILVGAITSKGIDLGFANRLIEADVLSKVDGLSLHPSVYCRNVERHTPERWIAWLRDVDASLRSIANKPVPLYLTEMGWPSNAGNCGVDEKTQAAYLARSFFLGRTLPDIKGMWWYDLVNEGTDQNEIKQNFGLLRQNLEPKPAYHTLKAISPTLRDFHYEAEKSRETDDNYLLRFSNGAEQILVAWSTAEDQTTHVEASSIQQGNVQLIDTGEPEKGQFDSGTPWKCNDNRCSAEVEITEFPKIISLGTRPPLFAQ